MSGKIRCIFDQAVGKTCALQFPDNDLSIMGNQDLAEGQVQYLDLKVKAGMGRRLLEYGAQIMGMKSKVKKYRILISGERSGQEEWIVQVPDNVHFHVVFLATRSEEDSSAQESAMKDMVEHFICSTFESWDPDTIRSTIAVLGAETLSVQCRNGKPTFASTFLELLEKFSIDLTVVEERLLSATSPCRLLFGSSRELLVQWPRLAKKLAWKALEDLKWFLEKSPSWIEGDAYRGMRAEHWKALPGLHRLVVLYILARQNKDLFDERDKNLSDLASEYGECSHVIDEAQEYKDLVGLATEFAELLRGRKGTKKAGTLTAWSPQSTALIAILTRSQRDSDSAANPTVIVKWAGDAQSAASSAREVYSQLHGLGGSAANDFLAFSQEPIGKIAIELSPSKAVEILAGLVDQVDVCGMVVRNRIATKGRALPELCASLGSDKCLPSIAQALVREFASISLPRGHREKYVSAICGPSVDDATAKEEPMRFLQECEPDLLLQATRKWLPNPANFAHAVNWTACMARAGKLVALFIAQSWLSDIDIIRYFEKCQPCKLTETEALLERIHGFVCDAKNEEDCSAQARVTTLVRQRLRMAMLVTACSREKHPQKALVSCLTNAGDSIPVEFLRFLVTRVPLDTTSRARDALDRVRIKYRALLLPGLQGASIDELRDQLLPGNSATREESMWRLGEWLESNLEHGASPGVSERLDAVARNCRAAQSDSFPQCLGVTHDDPILEEALQTFSDTGPACGLVHEIARAKLAAWPADEDALQVPTLARKEAAQIIADAFKGKGQNLQWKLKSMSPSTVKQQQRAICDILDLESGIPKAVAKYVDLLRVDASDVLKEAVSLHSFVTKTLRAPPPLQLAQFLEVYRSVDPRKLPVFGGPVQLCVEEEPKPQKPSLHHMCHEMERMLEPAEQRSWKQLQLITQVDGLIQFFKSAGMRKENLQEKLNLLRTMCISNRSLSRPVGILDLLSHHVLEVMLSTTRELQSSSILRRVGDLLKSGVLGSIAKEGLSVIDLQKLFALTDNNINIAENNMKVLESSKLVLDIESLTNLANLTFTSSNAVQSVRIERNRADTKALFRLAGGRTCVSLKGQDLHALFTEVQIELDVQANPGSFDDLHAMQKRVDTCFRVSEKLFGYAKLGLLSPKLVSSGNCEARLEFPMKPPGTDQTGSVGFEGSVKPDHDISSELKRFSNFDNNVSEVNEVLLGSPWLSWTKSRHIWHNILQEKPQIDHWTRMLLQISSVKCRVFVSGDGPCEKKVRKAISMWSRDRISLARFASNRNPPTLRLPERTGHAGVVLARVAGKQDQKNKTGILCLTALLQHLCGSSSEVLPTEVFPCDRTATWSAVDGLSDRLVCAANFMTTTPTSNGLGSDLHEADRPSVKGIMLGRGLLITHPESLELRHQERLLSALHRYAAAAVCSQESPVILVAVGKRVDNHFEELLQSTPGVAEMSQSEIVDVMEACTQVRPVNFVKGLWYPLDTIARGGPWSTKAIGYRVRIGRDTRIVDLVVAVKEAEQQNGPLVIDFGGDTACASGPLGGALMSLLVCGVIGQAQQAAAVWKESREIHIVFSGHTADPTAEFPFFSLLPEAVSSIQPLILDDDTALTNAFGPLIASASANGGQMVTDADVSNVVSQVFETEPAGISPQKTGSKNGIPFVHTPQSLRIMSQVLARVLPHAKHPSKANPLPILLAGDTGTGKTYLLLKLCEILECAGVLGSSAELAVCTLSAAFDRRAVESLGTKHVQTRASACASKGRIITYILDELTSSPAQESLSRLLCTREVRDGVSTKVRVPPGSCLLFATCNPEPILHSVFPLTAELQHARIDVSRLSEQEEFDFMRSQLGDQSRGLGLYGDQLDIAARLIWAARSCVTLGTVSLRDLVVCASLARRLGSQWAQLGAVNQTSMLEVLQEPTEGWAVRSENLRRIALACYVCYGMRSIPRSAFFTAVQEPCPSSENIQRFIDQVKDRIVSVGLNLGSEVVPTTTLKDNLIAAVIAVSTQQPLLCLGDDGTSKTLSLSLLLGQMQGKFSKTPFLQCLPRAQVFNLQLSYHTPAQHIKDLKETVQTWDSYNRNIVTSSVPAIFLEEMSMADEGPEGPLRALHDLLDIHQSASNDRANDIGTGRNSFSFLATSNYRGDSRDLPVGRALGNRMLVLAHEPLPDSSLIQLAITVGFSRCRSQQKHPLTHPVSSEEQRHEVQQRLEQSVTALLTHKLVPKSISIRSLLYFSQSFVNAALHEGKTFHQAEMLAFAGHLQGVSKEKSRLLWENVQSALGWGGKFVEPPHVSAVLDAAFAPGRSRRPLLLLYDSPCDVYEAACAVRSSAGRCIELWREHDESSSYSTSLHYICPISRNMVFAQQEQCLESKAVSMLEDTDQTLAAMLKLRSSLESGGVVHILNPGPMLEGMHALLNHAAAEVSTLQFGRAYEHVRVHSSTQLVLHVERVAALDLHPALISRLAIINSGLLPSYWPQQLPNGVSSAHEQLRRFYDESPVPGAEVQLDDWLERERALLSECEMSLEDWFESRRGSGPSAGSASHLIHAVLVHGSIPRGIMHKDGIQHVALTKSTPRDFLQQVQLTMKQRAAPSILVLDLTGATVLTAVETMILLGLAALKFDCPWLPEHFQTDFLRFCFKKAQVVLALDASCASAVVAPSNTNIKCLKLRFQLASRMRVIEFRDLVRPHKRWPSLAEISPDCIWEQAKAQVSEMVFAAPAGKGSVEQLQPSLIDVALRHFFPTSSQGVLCLASDRTTVFESRAEMVRVRARRFRDLTAQVLRGSARISLTGEGCTLPLTLRMALIESVRSLCCRVSSILLRKIPPQVFSDPKQDVVDFMQRILEHGTFSWQKHPITYGVSSFDSILRMESRSNRSEGGFPFLDDILEVLKRGSRHVCAQQLDKVHVSEILHRSFPKPPGSTRRLGPLIANGLISELVLRHRRLVGDHRDAARSWLLAFSGGTLADLLYTFLAFEPWLVLATHLEHGDPLVEQSASCAVEDGLIGLVLSTALNVLRQRSDTSPSPAVPLQFFHALQFALRDEKLDGVANGQHFAANLRTASALSSLWQLHRATACQASDINIQFNAAKALLLLEGTDVDHVLQLSREWVANVLRSPECEERVLQCSFVVNKCDKLVQLSAATMAGVLIALTKHCGDDDANGSWLLAQSAERRGNYEAAFAFIVQVLRLMLKRFSGSGNAYSALEISSETVLCARALHAYLRRSEIPRIDVIHNWITLQSDRAKELEPASKHALNLAVAAVSVQEQVESDNGCFKQQNAPTLLAFFHSPQLGGRACRSFLLQALVRQYDETRLHHFADVLPKIVGNWIAGCLKKHYEGPLQGLGLLGNFRQYLDDRNMEDHWFEALWKALGGSANGATRQDRVLALKALSKRPREVQRHVDGLEQAFCSDGKVMTVDQPAGRGTDPTSDLEEDNFDFCLQPLLIWNVILMVRARGGSLSSEEFLKDSTEEMSGWLVPAVTGDTAHQLRRIGLSLNQCPCGYIYGIDQCGRPMERYQCPGCKGVIGGEEHNWANGNHGLGMENFSTEQRGVPLDWFEGGVGYFERNLTPLQYRVLSVLVLLPLVVESRHRQRRAQQLRKHWNALKDVAELTSDTQTQYFLIGILNRAQVRNSFGALAMMGCSWNDPQGREQSEDQFARAFDSLMNRESPGQVARTAQESVETLQGHHHPLSELRMLHSAELSVEERADRFAPHVLQLSRFGDEEVCTADVAILKLAEEVLAASDPVVSFPLLVRCLFDADSHEVSDAVSKAIDLALPEKLQHLPTLVAAFLEFHTAVENHPEQTTADLISSLHSELRGSLEAAWEVCRYGQRVGCQYASDIGQLDQLPLELLVWMRNSKPSGGELTREETLLTSMVKAHNDDIERLRACSGVDEEAVAVMTAFVPSQIAESLVPWRKARSWLRNEACVVLKGKNWNARLLEVAVALWLRNAIPLRKFDLCAWRPATPPRSTVLRVTLAQQAQTIPGPAKLVLDKWIKEHGRLQDHLSSSLQWAERLADQVESGEGIYSPHGHLCDLVPTKTLPAPLRDMVEAPLQGASKDRLQVCHLNALQAFLAECMHLRQEEHLSDKYREPLPLTSHFGAAMASENAEKRRLALLKLVSLAEMIERNQFQHHNPLEEYLPHIDIDADEDGDDMDLAPFKGLQLRHIYHAVVVLRRLCTEKTGNSNL